MAEATSTANPPKKLGRWSTFFFFLSLIYTEHPELPMCLPLCCLYNGEIHYNGLEGKSELFFFFAGCIVKLFSQDTREDLETSMKILHCWRLMVLTQNQKLHTTMAKDVHMYTKLRGTLVNTMILCNLWQKSFVFLRW